MKAAIFIVTLTALGAAVVAFSEIVSPGDAGQHVDTHIGILMAFIVLLAWTTVLSVRLWKTERDTADLSVRQMVIERSIREIPERVKEVIQSEEIQELFIERASISVMQKLADGLMQVKTNQTLLELGEIMKGSVR